MIHGNDPNRCAECGCPKTLTGFENFKRKQAKDSIPTPTTRAKNKNATR